MSADAQTQSAPESAPKSAPKSAIDVPPWPTQLRYSRSRRILTARFDDGASFDIPAELLRVESPSAEVQGHGPDDKILVPGKQDVAITAIEPVGRYAVRLCFDDGHDTGYYTWETLYRYGRDATPLMADYEARLAEAGLSRR